MLLDFVLQVKVEMDGVEMDVISCVDDLDECKLQEGTDEFQAWYRTSVIMLPPCKEDVLSLYPGRLSSRTVSTIAGRISLKDSESNSRLDLFPLLFCNLLAWKHSDFLCKNYILNGLDNALYNVYSPMVNAKALWESLERKYKTEDAGSKKFVVGKFLDFKMVDSKTVISQVQEFQLILHDIHAEGMVLGESFQVAALIEKLPPTWKDFKNYLKHKRKEMKLEDLIVRLRIEEDNRQSEKKAGNYHQEAKANVVEQDVLSLYPGRLSSRTVSTIAGRISLKDSESNSRLDLFPLLFCNLLANGMAWQAERGTNQNQKLQNNWKKRVVDPSPNDRRSAGLTKALHKGHVLSLEPGNKVVPVG
ncbi:hypothetical protein RJ639_018321 [Escallonia herrerae]|uniref:Uncharacterized protein n=1 Tax=Escallonia herrerae TaxID=1293975 RepID=A0AA89AJQ5_9ASTE|nr:hypothetical protein RJ639_018321 [Escallonia herrerae]